MFEKSQKYGKDKAKFALFSGLYKQLVESVLLQFGFNAWSWSAAGYLLAKVGYGPEYQVCASNEISSDTADQLRQIVQSIVFVFLMFLVSSLPTLPLQAYGTFVLEEKHGFNKTTPTLFITDLLKGWGLAIVLGAPFLSIFLYVFQWAGDRFVPWLMGFM